VFALANPIPEIKPDDACAAGALDRNVAKITDEMKLAAAKKIAALVKKPTAEEIVPKVTLPGLVKAVASVVK
jgi:malate dehydrogenase (oxaloacetate-decarboxylating)